VTSLSVPRFGELLAPYISRVPDGSRPRFLALLERGAAERYRGWAVEVPEHADVLLECSRSEDEIADRIEEAFDLDASLRHELYAPLPEATRAYHDAFAPHPLWDQLRIQANAERQGAHAWRSIAAQHHDPAVVGVLLGCSALEEASADRLDALIAAHAPT